MRVFHLRSPGGPHPLDRQLDAAAEWLFAQDRLEVVIDGRDLPHSVHLKALRDAAPLVAPARTHPSASLVLVHPSPHTLQVLTRMGRTCLVLLSPPSDPSCEWQEAWIWAFHSTSLRPEAPAVADVVTGLSLPERWALGLRDALGTGLPAPTPLALRRRAQPTAGAR